MSQEPSPVSTPFDAPGEAKAMEVTRTSRGFAVSRGEDRYGNPWSVQDSSLATEDCIWLGSDGDDGGRAHLTRSDVAALLPLLNSFVETGTITALRTPMPARVEPAIPADKRERATEIARKLMVAYFGPGKSSATPASWVIDAMLAFRPTPSSTDAPARVGEGERNLRSALANLAAEMRHMLRANPEKDGGLYRQRLTEAEAALATTPTNTTRADNGFADLHRAVQSIGSNTTRAESEGAPCAFMDCPPGLFVWNDLLCFKSEYSSKPGQPDAYCIDTGEYFWGGVSGDLAARRALIVTPLAGMTPDRIATAIRRETGEVEA